MGLYLINALAVVFILVGFHLAFRQKLVLAWRARLRGAGAGERAEAGSGDREGVASVLRIAGVMIMAFSFTGAAFANLIAYYTAASAG